MLKNQRRKEKDMDFETFKDTLSRDVKEILDKRFGAETEVMFHRSEKANPDHFAVRQYVKYKMAAGVATCN